jgi:hypothetical protein
VSYLVRHSLARIASRAAQRPPEWLAELEACVVKRDAKAVWVDVELPAWGAMWQKYRGYVPAFDLESRRARMDRMREEFRARRDERGRRAWAVLHTEGIGKNETWLAEWEKSIPCGECRQGYRVIKAELPPTFPLPPEWTWALHNAVNAKLNKPTFTLEQAAQRWGWR